MLEDLEDILDITFVSGINIDFINIVDAEDEDRFRKEGSILHLNVDKLDGEERDEVQRLLREQFESHGRVLRHDEATETNAMDAGYDDELDEILTFFDGILSQRYHTILEKALHLRGLIEQQDLTKDEIQRRKGQIARRHGAEAIYLCSVTSAGYFDPNGGLRDLLVDMGLNDNYDQYDFQPTLEDLVERKLLCVFVENDETIYGATQEVRGRLAKYQQEDPINEWFDIRGIGEDCAEIIDGVMDNLEEEFIGIDYDRWRDEEDLWVRIYPRSLPQIN